jgi:hypothetical protein
MFALLARFYQVALVSFAAQARQDGGIANGLMERAEARAGSNPQEAQELRQAASAYLRVVR